MTPKIIADFETQLSTSLAIAGTSFSLASGTDDDGVALPAGLYYFTVDNGTSNKEYLAGTLSGTSVTAVLSVSRQGVETSGAVRAHRVGASCILTDFATYMKYMNAIALVSAPDASTVAKGVVEAATLAEVRARTGTGGTGAKLVATPDMLTDLPTVDEKAAMAGGGTLGTPSTTNKYLTETGLANKAVIFGGDGSNGALTIVAGTTTVNLAGAAYFELNYTTISITGSGNLNFSNPHANGTVIVIKSQGDVTLTSSTVPNIDASGMGAIGGAHAVSSINSGSPGTDGKTFGFCKTNGGAGSSASNSGGGGGLLAATGAATAGAALTMALDTAQFSFQAICRVVSQFLFVGAGGAGAGCANTTGSAGFGGRGGGCLIMECAGSLNFTVANGISVAGAAGPGATCSGNSGGAGGGGAGMFLLFYKLATAITGTINKLGGTGGAPTGTGAAGGTGGTGYSNMMKVT